MVFLEYAIGLPLVMKHVGVTAFLAEIDGERVTGPHRFQARILVNLAGGLGDAIGTDRKRIGFAAAVARVFHVDRAPVMIVLSRVVPSPDCRVEGLLVQRSDAKDSVAGLGLALGDVLAQQQHGSEGQRRADRHQDIT